MGVEVYRKRKRNYWRVEGRQREGQAAVEGEQAEDRHLPLDSRDTAQLRQGHWQALLPGG